MKGLTGEQSPEILRLTRRQVLLAAGLASLEAVSTSCGLSGEIALQVAALKGTLPASLWGEYRRRISAGARSLPLADRAALFEFLQPPKPSWLARFLRLWGFNPSPVSQPLCLSLLGADWLDSAIAQDLLLPWPAASLGDRVATLPAPWSQVGIRQGQIWAVPWSWGVAAIAYDRRKVSTPITDWSDLWRPDLRGKLTLPDHPRDTIGLVLKSLGQSYNASAIEPSPALRKALARLNEQALFYTSSDYLQVLEIGDSWVAVGWTSDLYQLQELNANVEIVIPKSGTALWWDAWVLPRHRNPTLESGESSSEWKALTAQWFDLLLDPETAETVVSLSHTPLVVPTPAEHLPRQIRDRALFNAAVLDRSEVLNPLPEPEAIAYLDLWRRMRTETL